MVSQCGRCLAYWACLCLCVALSPVLTADAMPMLRFQVDQPGDFVMFGNTLAQDCRTGVPAPVVGTVGDCGGTSASTEDTGADVFWAADDPISGSATASIAITADQRRSSAVLTLPPGALVTYARLYWSAELAQADLAATLEVPGGARQDVVADAWVTAVRPFAQDTHFYQATADVTDLVRDATQGGTTTAFRVSGVDSVEFAASVDEMSYASWTIVVFLFDPAQPNRNLSLFDGLDVVDKNSSAVVELSGFHVPLAGFDARLGVVAYEGDGSIAGDSLSFNGSTLSDATNTADNFFNGSRSTLGIPQSNAGDLPQLTGAAGSMSGIDMDVVDVAPLLAPGDTRAVIQASTTQDVYLLGVFVTSISTLAPSFETMFKSGVDLNGGALLPGDVVEFTIDATNTGNDPAVDVVLEDSLESGLAFVRGSLEIVAGANAGPLTDAVHDDQGEYLEGSHMVQVRLGAYADGVSGGRMNPGEPATVRFKATYTGTAAGFVRNQASILARGLGGSPMQAWGSDSDRKRAGSQPTVLQTGTVGDEDLSEARDEAGQADDPGLQEVAEPAGGDEGGPEIPAVVDAGPDVEPPDAPATDPDGISDASDVAADGTVFVEADEDPGPGTADGSPDGQDDAIVVDSGSERDGFDAADATGSGDDGMPGIREGVTEESIFGQEDAQAEGLPDAWQPAESERRAGGGCSAPSGTGGAGAGLPMGLLLAICAGAMRRRGGLRT